VATWEEFELADAELAAFGRERLDGRVCFHATLRRDGGPRVHPVEPWIAAGLLMVRFRGGSPKVTEVAGDPPYALHSPMDNPNGEGGEFLVRGRMVPVTPDHPAAAEIVRTARVPLALYTLSVEDAVGTTYEGAELDPVYRRWGASGAATPRDRARPPAS
jgi:hypothetical protein